MKRLLRLLLPAGLRGQIAGILVLGLVFSQIVAAALYLLLQPYWQRDLRPDVAVTKVATIVRLLESTDAAKREAHARIWNEDGFRVEYDATTHALPRHPDTADNPGLRALLADTLARSPDAVWVSPSRDTGATTLQVLLRDGGLLKVVTPIGMQLRIGLLEQIAIMVFLMCAAAGLWALVTWAVSRPLTRFARAAERVGIDVHAPPLPVEGPAELQRATHAFNEMQERLQRMLRDRTLMLGAISHDLGTPLTRLRLRVETGRVADNQDKMLQDIETLQAMLASALAFVRGVDDAEPRAVVDLDSLLQTVCDLVTDLGAQVAYEATGRGLYHCKPQSLQRALLNIVTNATKYGERAEVSLRRQPTGYEIEVQDEGPGISDTEKPRVFEPFYRTTTARESDRQGMGLGLSIARSIILAHGGTIDLLDRAPHGLTVRIFLPEATDGVITGDTGA